MSIPKKLHIVWVGNSYKAPLDCIESWQRNHTAWQLKLWTDSHLEETSWINAAHLRAFASVRQWPAVADLMRYEILYREGGIYVDADSFSLRPLDDWLLEAEMFACWEDTLAIGRARLVSNAFLGSIPQNPFLRYLIDTIGKQRELFKRWSWSRLRHVRMGSWRSVGPYRLTKCIFDYEGSGYRDISILPSHMFCPNHYRGKLYSGRGIVYADHRWATTRKLYDQVPDSVPISSTSVPGVLNSNVLPIADLQPEEPASTAR